MLGGAALEAALEVIRALEGLRVDYLVGGSMSSTAKLWPTRIDQPLSDPCPAPHLGG